MWIAAIVRPADALILVLYLLAMVAMGFWFMRRGGTTETYFLGDRNFPAWAIAFSMVGTSISSITFLALPAAAFALDWRQFVPNLALPAVVLLAVAVIIPRFRSSGRTTAFEYLEDRFGPWVRLYGAASYLVLQIVRIGTILYLVSIPISILTGLSITWAILVTGVFVAVYTVAGGIEAVIWTDVVQTIILALGGPVCLLVIIRDLPGGFDQILRTGWQAAKFGFGSWEWGLAQRTLPAMVLVGLFQWLGEHVYSQHVVQRYLAARSTRAARVATGMFAAVSLPIWAFFFLLGTSLWVYYQALPDPAIAGMDAESILPHFVLTRVPAGLTGLIIAGVVAAAMSSLDSSLNSMATIATVDIVRRHVMPGRSDAVYLRVAQILSCAASGVMIGGALVFSRISKESMMDVGFTAISIFAGCLLGVFLVGFFTTRVHDACVLPAIGAALALDAYLVLCHFGLTPVPWGLAVHTYWIGILVNALFIVLAYVLSLIKPPRRMPSPELTVWRTGRSPSAAPGFVPLAARSCDTEVTRG